eukprot:c24771_g1_i1 orf=275-622(+)
MTSSSSWQEPTYNLRSFYSQEASSTSKHSSSLHHSLTNPAPEIELQLGSSLSAQTKLAITHRPPHLALLHKPNWQILAPIKNQIPIPAFVEEPTSNYQQVLNPQNSEDHLLNFSS